ncbi:MAG: tRNA pseudouridine(38-40) synthase TruA [Ignavibacteriaceae bacterium]|nr:tRNA pseudouridine(38-40) synthase TruA [Ignavibacteriaceae bacterium]
MNNYKLLIQYDGTEYAGWQYQDNAVTIQQKIFAAIKTLIGENVNLIGSGRTDAGVHALGQVANFATEKDIDVSKFQYSLNSILPKDISILKLEKTFESFHSRFDAKERIYLYLISKYKSPFYDRFSYFYHGRLECDRLNSIAKVFLGKHDFTSFCKKNSETENKVCTVFNIHWKETKGMIFFRIEADRFLHGMVRTVAGTLLDSFKNNLDETHIIKVLEQKNREAAGESVPAKGLFLFKVKY